MKRIHLRIVVALVLLTAMHNAAADENIDAMRAELDALKTQYKARINALEARLNATEQQLTQQQQNQPAAVASYTPPPATNSANDFNPAMGIIVNGAMRTYDNDPQDHFIRGFPAGGESQLADEGLSIGESEFVFSANVDDWFYGQITAAVEQEDGSFNISLEEAFLDTLSMPANTTLRFGRFYSSVGYLNDKHAHTWEFADQALPYRAFMGSQYGDDGIQFRWLAPTDFFLELGGEVFRGSNFPAAGDASDGLGTKSLFVHLGGDLGYSHSWSAGFSWLDAEARDRISGDVDNPLNFNGSSDIYIADFVWKWAPNGNIRERNLTFQSEYFWRNEKGQYTLPDTDNPLNIDNDATGWYTQLVYQWRPRWRVGMRIDGLSQDGAAGQLLGTPLDSLNEDPLRYSIMFDYSNSEFSRIRLQFNHDESGLNNDNQFTLQYIMSIGAHGGHEF